MNTSAITFLTAFLTLSLIIAGRELGGNEGVLIAFAFALLMHAISYWFSDRITLRIYGAKEIHPDQALWLHRVVQELAFRVQMPMPKLYLLPRRTTTAFATGRSERHAAVAVTDDIQIRDNAKLQSVLTRELSQIKHRDRLVGTIAASATGAISALAIIAP